MMNAGRWAASAGLVLVAGASVAAAVRMPWQSGDVDLEEEVAALAQPYDQQDLMALVVTAFVALIAGIQVAPNKSILSDFVKEMAGTVLMVVCTFAPGPLFGHLGISTEWPMHMLGVIVADKTMGGPHVNPGVTISMFVWGQVNLVQAIVIILAQLVGAVISFPLLQAMLNPFEATVGGPSFDATTTPLKDGFANEFAGFALLMAGIFGLCCTALGQRYYIKQSLLAGVIRFVIYFFGVSGPAINPALGTVWAFYDSGNLPRDTEHYIVYWLAPALAGAAMTLLWSAGTKTGIFAEKAPKTKTN